MFEPSKFVYAYFAFNSFYNFDWEVSIKNNQLTLFSNNEVGSSEKIKFGKMIDFIFKHTTQEERIEFVRFIREEGQISNQTLNADQILKANQTLKTCINKIVPDKNISRGKLDNFKSEFKNLIETENLKLAEIKDVILGFIYSVRNNVFHGT